MAGNDCRVVPRPAKTVSLLCTAVARLRFIRTFSMRLILLLIILSFQPLGRGLLAQSIPANAAAAPYGAGWTCNRGYARVGQTCERVDVPENAELSYTGASWVCLRGFRQNGSACELIVVPANASIDYTGHAWTCDRGFYRRDSACVQLRIPENGELSYTGSSWTCVRGFVRADSGCAAVAIPDHAELSASGAGWTCLRGYKRAGTACEAVMVPANATLSAMGHDWSCSEGFRRSNDVCVVMTDEERAAAAAKSQRLAADLAAMRAQRARGGSCTREYRSNAQVCVTPARSDFDCTKSYSGESYSGCDLTIRYDIQTDYAGQSSISADVQCQADIEYAQRKGGLVGSDRARKSGSHFLYAKGSDSGRLHLSFSFSSYQTVQQVHVATLKCEVTSLILN